MKKENSLQRWSQDQIRDCQELYTLLSTCAYHSSWTDQINPMMRLAALTDWIVLMGEVAEKTFKDKEEIVGYTVGALLYKVAKFEPLFAELESGNEKLEYLKSAYLPRQTFSQIYARLIPQLKEEAFEGAFMGLSGGMKKLSYRQKEKSWVKTLEEKVLFLITEGSDTSLLKKIYKSWAAETKPVRLRVSHPELIPDTMDRSLSRAMVFVKAPSMNAEVRAKNILKELALSFAQGSSERWARDMAALLEQCQQEKKEALARVGLDAEQRSRVADQLYLEWMKGALAISLGSIGDAKSRATEMVQQLGNAALKYIQSPKECSELEALLTQAMIIDPTLVLGEGNEPLRIRAKIAACAVTLAAGCEPLGVDFEQAHLTHASTEGLLDLANAAMNYIVSQTLDVKTMDHVLKTITVLRDRRDDDVAVAGLADLKLGFAELRKLWVDNALSISHWETLAELMGQANLSEWAQVSSLQKGHDTASVVTRSLEEHPFTKMIKTIHDLTAQNQTYGPLDQLAITLAEHQNKATALLEALELRAILNPVGDGELAPRRRSSL